MPHQKDQKREDKESEESPEEAVPVVEELPDQPKQANTGGGFVGKGAPEAQSINEPNKKVGGAKLTSGVASSELESRRTAVRNAYLHTWNNYERYAWGHDELKPLSKSAQDWLSMGLSIVDSIDTMYLMGLTDEYEKARNWILTNLNFDSVCIRGCTKVVISNYCLVQRCVIF